MQCAAPHPAPGVLTATASASGLLQGTKALKCKRWSYRSKDGTCRLFGTGGSGYRTVAVENKTAKDQEWASGTAERYATLAKPGQVQPGKASCQFISMGGSPGGVSGAAALRPAPPPPSSSRKMAQPLGR